ncbi:hypothetical protein Q669_24740 [Labrenzia sp. C1B10]|nr:hypothetical protein Q669_24740 [Labrenzia sp. C1B10]ERS09128.1 hypothetical protein Q675_17115 [Labrenzia sp. C1B70]
MLDFKPARLDEKHVNIEQPLREQKISCDFFDLSKYSY